MGTGLSKTPSSSLLPSKKPSSTKQPPPVVSLGAPVRGFDDDGWEIAVPHALRCPDSQSPQFPSAPSNFDTPNGGAGVGSLRQRHLDEPLGAGELSELPPTALSVEVLEVGGLNDSATPVLHCPYPPYRGTGPMLTLLHHGVPRRQRSRCAQRCRLLH